MKLLYKQLPDDKIKINGNDNPIKMDTFLSFLTIDTEKSKDHLGSSNGWTRHLNEERDLIVQGGIVGGTEYLDSIRYGRNLDNPYNNFVNPFYLEDIMTKEGVKFFFDYYKDEIREIILDKENDIKSLKEKLNNYKEELSELAGVYDEMNNL